jgi:large subunit ribosomal protein L23
MIHTLDVIKKPFLTEENIKLYKEKKVCVFIVNKLANKEEIKKAFKVIFNIQPEKVNIVNYKGKKKNMGRYKGTKASFKKAYIKLEEGATLLIFDQFFQKKVPENKNNDNQ